MTVGIVATAATRSITLTTLRIRSSGKLDLRGFLGLDPTVNPGYDQVTVHVDATSPAPENEVRAAIEAALATSPNLNNFRRAISVEPVITASDGA
ncbi:hypothetical protein [Micromonospora sp. CPCC 206061]|uniref:hypothetical protein n=1 Tax=Micromonospora sp. CPCC 206061 TaxID=3122410 RepID=UPI002FF2A4B2